MREIGGAEDRNLLSASSRDSDILRMGQKKQEMLKTQRISYFKRKFKEMNAIIRSPGLNTPIGKVSGTSITL